MSRQDKATTERNAKTLRELVKRPENKVCADCKRNDPRWASWNLGVFVCIRCSGIHRSMGTHISKVKSVDLDMWTPEQMKNVQAWGNERANLYWEAHLKPGHMPPDHKVESFIRSKYESKRWAMEGPLPSDPTVLDARRGQEVPELEAPPPAPTPAVQPPPPQAQATSSRSRIARTSLNPNTFVPPASNPADPVLTPAASKPAPPAPAPKPQPPQSAQADLFSLDFSPPSATSAAATAPPAPKKDVKNDILSLFGSAPPAAVPTVNAFAGAPVAAAPPTAPTTFMGGAGTGLWGAQSGWSAPAPSASAADPWGSFTSAPSQPPVQPHTTPSTGFGFGQPQQQPLQANNIWGTPAASKTNALDAGSVWASNAPATAPAQNATFDLFASPAAGSAATSQQPKKDDAFGDIWGDFK